MKTAPIQDKSTRFSDSSQITSNLPELQERAKELNCLYAIGALLNNASAEQVLQDGASIDEIMSDTIRILQTALPNSNSCPVRINIMANEYQVLDFQESPCSHSANIRNESQIIGSIAVHYLQRELMNHGELFLQAKAKLINTIAFKIGNFLQYLDLVRRIKLRKF